MLILVEMESRNVMVTLQTEGYENSFMVLFFITTKKKICTTCLLMSN